MSFVIVFDLILELMVKVVLMEDFGSYGDVIICVVILVEMIYVVWLNVCEDCVVLGMQIVVFVFCMVDFVFEFIMCVGDGESVEKGMILMEIKGFVVLILLVECVVLNYVG